MDIIPKEETVPVLKQNYHFLLLPVQKPPLLTDLIVFKSFIPSSPHNFVLSSYQILTSRGFI